MYEIIFYHSRNGESEIEDYLDDLKRRSYTDKNARVNRTRILAYIKALSQYGTRIGQPAVKHLEGDIWELRPLKTAYFFSTGKMISLFCCIIL